MRATEEAAFWLYSAKDWTDLKPTLFLWRANCFSSIVINGGSPPEAHRKLES